MEIKNTLGANQLRKVALLITKASDLGMDINGYGFADENSNSGNVYLWLEDYPFCLYIGLGSDEVWANWSDPYDGEEHDIDVDGESLDDLFNWCEDLQRAADSEKGDE